MTVRSNFIANQIFIGCPWKNVKPKYERAIIKLIKKFPLSFAIIGRENNQDAADLLTMIKSALDSSSYAIFDTTLGNANVSLEFGYAEGRDIPRVLYVSSHAASRRENPDRAIISDLAGKKYIPYTTEAVLVKSLEQFCKNHAYTRRFENFLRGKFADAPRGVKKSIRSLALKIIHCLDGRIEARREDISQQMLSEGYSDYAVEYVLKALHRAKLIYIEVGRYADVHIS